MRIGEMSWTEVQEVIGRGAAAIVPLGSIEEHGPHSPMGDYMAIHDVAGRTGEATGDLVVPTLPFGFSEYFRHYAGTITLRDETLSKVVEDIIDCLLRHRLRHIVISNGHAGNMPILELLARRIRRTRGISIPTISPLQVMQNPALIRELYREGAVLGHGGEPMGSLNAGAGAGQGQDGACRRLWAATGAGHADHGLGAIVFKGVRVSMPLDMREVTSPETGSQSDPSQASVERGRALLDYAVNFCVEFMKWFKTTDPKVAAE
jgi:creatinine amidohydrolase